MASFPGCVEFDGVHACMRLHRLFFPSKAVLCGMYGATSMAWCLDSVSCTDVL